MSSLEAATHDEVRNSSRVWQVLTTIGAVLIAVVILGVMQLKYSQPQELH